MVQGASLVRQCLKSKFIINWPQIVDERKYRAKAYQAVIAFDTNESIRRNLPLVGLVLVQNGLRIGIGPLELLMPCALTGLKVGGGE